MDVEAVDTVEQKKGEGEPAKPAATAAKIAAKLRSGKKKPDDEGGEDKSEQMAAGISIDEVLKAIKDGTITVAEMDALLTAIAGAREAKGAGNVNDQPTVSPPAPANAPGEAMAATRGGRQAPAASNELARVAGENAVLKARLDERDRADKRAADVAVAMKRLEGRPLGTDIEKKLVKFHTEHGPKAFAAYVDSIVAMVGALPSGSDYATSAFAGQPVPLNGESDTVNSYIEHGSEALQKAAKFAAEYQQLRDRGLTRVADEERYVQLNMERLGYKLRKKKTG